MTTTPTSPRIPNLTSYSTDLLEREHADSIAYRSRYIGFESITAYNEAYIGAIHAELTRRAVAADALDPEDDGVHVDAPTGEQALIVSPESVPQSANFEFAYNGYSFFTLTGGLLVAVPR